MLWQQQIVWQNFRLSNSMDIYDVLVIGAGPAGSNAALRLAREGHRVALIDWRAFPRDKTCGDGLIADSIRHLKKIELYDQVAEKAHAVHRIMLFGSGENNVTFEGHCLTVRRFELDFLLQQAAVKAGAVFYSGKINRLEQAKDEKVVAHFMDGRASLQARYAIVATGTDVSLLRSLGMVRQRTPTGIAVRGYLRSSVTVQDLVISFHQSIPNGYGWIFPVGNGEYNVGCGYCYPKNKIKGPDPRHLLTVFLQQFELGRRLLADGEWISPIKGAPLRCGLKGTQLIRGRVVAAGESIATTFPLTGEGIGKAMETGFAAGEYVGRALKENNPELLGGYKIYISTLADKYTGYNIAQRIAKYAWYTDLLIKRAQKNPSLHALLRGVLEETVDLKSKFTFRRVCKLFFFRR